MFQTLAIPFHSQSPSFTTNFLSISSSQRDLHRPFTVRCRAAAPNDFAGCLVVSQNSTPASFYEVLKVKQNASPPDIKTAYQQLSKIYHPDVIVQSLDEPNFIRIHNTYETLSDPKARAIYDRSISLIGRRMVARSAILMTSFGFYASSSSSSSSSSSFSSSSSSSSLGRRAGFYPNRRWESAGFSANFST